jgi:DNA-binding transcriptional LysR family regulator
MQLGWLRTFVVVYRTGSFTRAARRLELSQPAVTQQIRGLEQELGRPLFERHTQGVKPTAAAEQLIRSVQGPVDALDDAVRRQFGLDRSQRPVYLGGPAELITARVLPAISDLIADGVQFRIGLGLADDLLADLEAGLHDLVLSTVRPRIRGVESTPLVDEVFALMGSAQVAAQISAKTIEREGPEALFEFPLIAYAEFLPIIRRYWRSVFDVRLTTVPAVVVPDLRGVLAAVRSSAGISVLPTYLCAEELARGEVVPLLEPEIPPINTFYLANRVGALGREQIALVHGHLRMKAQVWA